MKKRIIVLIIVIVSLSIVYAALYFATTTSKYTGEFSISKFSDKIENIDFQTEKTYGRLNDYKSAAAEGKAAIAEHFEDSSGSIFKWMGCDVQYDQVNDVYYVRTYQLFPPVLGGAYDVIMKSDGTILAIWGEK